MAIDDVPFDDKVKRTRDLLSSFYSQEPSSTPAPANTSSRYATLDTINTTSFDPDQYMNLLVQKSNLEGLLQRHVEMAAEIKNLDTDLQMLVYENYNKFISATDTIKRMKNNIVGMEANMEQLLDKIMSVQSRSDGVNNSLFEKREHIEKLHRTRNLLLKIQFIYDLPTRLGRCIKSGAYGDAVRLYTGAMPILKAYGNSSFQDCKRASEDAVAIIIKNLQGKVFSDTESIQARAEAVMLLKQLDFPVESLKLKLLEKLEQFLTDLDLESRDTRRSSVDPHESTEQGSLSDSAPTVLEVSTREFVEAVRAYRVIFPDSEKELIKLVQDLITKHFEASKQHIKKEISSADLLILFRFIWNDVLLLDEVLPEASLSDFAFEAALVAVKQFVGSTFSRLLRGISDALLKAHSGQKEAKGEEYPLQAALEASKKAVMKGSMDVLLEFRHLLDDDLDLILKLKDLIIDWVQEGFQDFFRRLNDQFHLLTGRNVSMVKEQSLTEGLQGDRVVAGLVLVIAQLCVFIEQSGIPRITEEIAASFSGGGARGYEHGPAFIPAEICRTFRSAGEKFLHLYINMRSQKISVLLRKRLTMPNWVKHKEPREVHMFVDLFLQELEAIGTEVKQILPQGLRKHRRTESNGSTASSLSNPLKDDKITRSNTHKARSQLLETHLAKLFKQKLEVFTKVAHTQESVLTTVIKLCLKSLQEFVRLQTFNRSGFQQIQLDVQFLRSMLRNTSEEEAVVDFLLDEVIVAAAERCLDPSPLEPAILDKLIQAKLAKSAEQ